MPHDTIGGTTLNSATALCHNPTTPLLHVSAPPSGLHQVLFYVSKQQPAWNQSTSTLKFSAV